MCSDSRKRIRKQELHSMEKTLTERLLYRNQNLRLTPHYWHLHFLRETIQSYINDLFLSSVITSSAMVECCLLWEFIRENPKFQKAGATIPDGINLGVLFDYFKDKKTPIDQLLNTGESLDQKPSTINYIQIRNKYAHGDMWKTITNPSLFLPELYESESYGIPVDEYLLQTDRSRGFENIAYIHLRKSLLFMLKFTEYIREKNNLSC